MRDGAILLALTVLALVLHGYRLAVDDMATYLPAIKKNLDPGLYPFDAFFFLAQTRLTLFDELVAGVTRATALPLEWVIFGLYLLVVFGLLAGVLALSRRCFTTPAGQWGAVAIFCALAPLHATGTRIQMLDPCLHPRGLATVGILFAMVAVLDHKPHAFAWLVAAAAIHPQMAALGTLHLSVLWVLTTQAGARVFSKLGAASVPLAQFAPPNDAWREVMQTRTHHFPLRWPWYEWLGVVLPLSALWWFARDADRRGHPVRARVCRSLVLSSLIGIAIAVVVGIVPGFERLVPVQFMRVLHIVYIVCVCMLGGVLGERFLQRRPLRWGAAFCMFAAPVVIGYNFFLFSGSAHIELPGARPHNPWVEAFEWVRENTPRNALFALDPHYIDRPGQDGHGFRALAERSALADYVKDRGVAGLFPEVAPEWLRQVRSLEKWPAFGERDFHRLKQEYGVDWVVLARVAPVGLECPYANHVVAVCRIE